MQVIVNNYKYTHYIYMYIYRHYGVASISRENEPEEETNGSYLRLDLRNRDIYAGRIRARGSTSGSFCTNVGGADTGCKKGYPANTTAGGTVYPPSPYIGTRRGRPFTKLFLAGLPFETHLRTRNETRFENARTAVRTRESKRMP